MRNDEPLSSDVLLKVMWLRSRSCISPREQTLCLIFTVFTPTLRCSPGSATSFLSGECGMKAAIQLAARTRCIFSMTRRFIGGMALTTRIPLRIAASCMRPSIGLWIKSRAFICLRDSSTASVL
jgi:hypothetical protein